MAVLVIGLFVSVGAVIGDTCRLIAALQFVKLGCADLVEEFRDFEFGLSLFLGGLFLEPPNFEPANPLKTPEHIVPVWYFTPFYAMLRAVPPMFNSQFPGVVVMFAAIIVLFFLPWLDRSPVKSIRYKGPIFKIAIAIFVVSFIMLGYLGTQPTTDLYKLLAQIGTVLYFLFFLLMPIYSKLDKTKPVPERVTK